MPFLLPILIFIFVEVDRAPERVIGREPIIARWPCGETLAYRK